MTSVMQLDTQIHTDLPWTGSHLPLTFSLLAPLCKHGVFVNSNQVRNLWKTKDLNEMLTALSEGSGNLV